MFDTILDTLAAEGGRLTTRELQIPGTETLGKKGGKRRLLPIIDARFQWKYTLVVTLLGAGTGAVMGGLLYRANLDNTRLLELGGNPELLQQVQQGDAMFLAYLVLCIVGLAAGLCVWGLVVTHRIAGPMYLAARYLELLRQGTYPEVRPLRKNDELQHVFNTLGALSSQLRDRDAAVCRALDDALRQLATALDNPAQASSALQQASSVLQQERNHYRPIQPPAPATSSRTTD